jgi:predicted NUDIX family phosphoesterase
MSITVDDRTFMPHDLGIETVGDLLTLVQKDERLITNLLIDGAEPDLSRLHILRKAPVAGHTIYVETAEPRRMAMEVLDEVDKHLDEADALKAEAIDMLSRDQVTRALERLGRCFGVWYSAQESVVKTAQLLRIDLSKITLGDTPLTDVLDQFKEQLLNIRTALENRDFVSLSDSLQYETTETTDQWRQAVQAVRAAIGA